jgi:sterol desaturase/sphingolipid hydroxylase (fatty acid hydroxylase superfamily)
MILLIALIAAGFIVVERLWPAQKLPQVHGWWARVALINVIQLLIVLLAGVTWDRWLTGFSLFRLRDHMGDLASGGIVYLVSTFIYYWWHRTRHESKLFWRLCHQLHHSTRRIEVIASFYKHPVEILINSILSSAIAYSLLGCTPLAAGYYLLFAAIAEFFYHCNIRTPHWLGYLFQRPESHRIHHQYRRHTGNFADLPIWDILFGTFKNPHTSPKRCGFDPWREERFEDILGFRDVHAAGTEETKPFQLLPTCIGCSKRWACATTANAATTASTQKEPQP